MSELRRVELGTLRAPSGKLLVVDPGYLNLWSHNATPQPYVTESGEEIPGVDFKIVGPDAEKSGAAYDRQWHPGYLYDIPAHHAADTIAHFAEESSKHKLNASLHQLSAQIPHRERFDKAVSFGNGGGEVQFHGIWNAALSGLPTHELKVVATRFTEGPDTGRWRSVTIECSSKPVATTDKVGMVMVDYARLLIADVDALENWSDESLNGKADIVFWGVDAQEVAALVKAEQFDERQYGWINLDIPDAIDVLSKLEDTVEAKGLKIRIDQRPHSHHYLLMAQVRQSDTESGTLEIGSARLFGFMTTWGDGIFPVFRDLAADGSLVQIRIDVGCDEIVARQRDMDELWTGIFSKYALVSKMVTEGKRPVRYMYREAGDNEQDSGWRVLGGNETAEYQDDPGNISVVPLRDLIANDKTLKPIFRTEAPCAFYRKSHTAPFEREERS